MDNASVVRTLFEKFFNEGDADIVDDLVAEDYNFHNGPAGMPRTREAFKSGIGYLRAVLPDMHWEIGLLVASEDMVVVRSTLTGTHLGEFLGIPPTGKSILAGVADFYRLEDAKIVEHWDVVDNLAVLLRMEAALPPAIVESADMWGLLAIQ